MQSRLSPPVILPSTSHSSLCVSIYYDVVVVVVQSGARDSDRREKPAGKGKKTTTFFFVVVVVVVIVVVEGLGCCCDCGCITYKNPWIVQMRAAAIALRLYAAGPGTFSSKVVKMR